MNPREWYVRLDNLVTDSHVGYKRIITYYDVELRDAILKYYDLPLSLKERMRIWSSPFRMRRLDHLSVIPDEYIFVSVTFW